MIREFPNFSRMTNEIDYCASEFWNDSVKYQCKFCI